MSRVLHPVPENPPIPDRERSPFPDGPWGQVGAAVAMLAFAGTILALMGRHFSCPCGRIAFWQGALNNGENSQQFADWYSFLHVVFGMGLFAVVRSLRPHWPLAPVLLAVVFGHSIWEVVENTPVVIHVFSGATNAPHYEGDSLLNSLGDTTFALAGALLMPVLPLVAVAAIVVLAEATVTWGAHDGFVVGTLRLLRVNV